MPAGRLPSKLTTKKQVHEYLRRARQAGKSIGFVPTMGALHKGHLSLTKTARAENDLLIVSIFVNPTQFGPGEDYDGYPRRLEEDLKLCAREKVDAVFAPTAGEMYAGEASTFIEPGPLGQRLEGMSRPSHFRGVCTVVAKLLNITRPDRLYLGQKDAQQLAVARQMVRDLDYPTEVVACPTVREPDGLAISSRNAYLSGKERNSALALSRALDTATRMVSLGETNAPEIAAAMAEQIVVDPLCELDYAAVVDPVTFEDIAEVKNTALAALAVRVGRARLIDNVLLVPDRE